MGRAWFCCGGWAPECLSATLEVKDERLFGTRGRESCEILPADIVDVIEFGFNNPFLLVTTRRGRFHVGALTRQYDDVIRVLERYVGSGFCHRFVHRWNVFFYRRRFKVRSWLASFFRLRRRNGVARRKH